MDRWFLFLVKSIKDRGYISLIVLFIFLVITWFGESFYNAVMFLISSLLGLIAYQNYEKDQPKLVAQVVKTKADVTYTHQMREKEVKQAAVLRLIIVNTGRSPILLTSIENGNGTHFFFSFIDQKAQIQNIKSYKRERNMGYLLEPYKSFEDFIQIDERVKEMGIEIGIRNKGIYEESSRVFIRDVEQNKYQAIRPNTKYYASQ